jgi:hypothetical protein
MITPSFALTATERVLPRMALDFTTASLDSRVTFTRSGNTATVTNSSGNVVGINANLPRFDFNPITLACKGLLIEEARTNVFLYSDQFENAAWFKSSTSVSADEIVSPDGTQNADKIVEDVSGVAEHFAFQSFVATATAYTMSVYLKSGERIWSALRLFDGTTSYLAFFNLSTGAAGSVTAGATSKIENAGNGWYRCSITATLTAVESFPSIFVSTGDGTTFYAGDGTSGIYAWGAQLELGAFPTSYIPTVATSVTRTADVATMTGTNFSDWYNQTQGAFMTQVIVPQIGRSGRILDVSTGSVANKTTIGIGASNITQVESNVGGGFSGGAYTANTISVNTPFKVCSAYSSTQNKKISLNASTLGNAAFAIATSMTTLILGTQANNAAYLNGCIGEVLYWPLYLTENEIIAFSK